MSIEEGEAKAQQDGLMFIETSAKAGVNIKALFRKIASALPGMETVTMNRTSNLVDVKLTSKANGAQGGAPAAANCAC